MTPTFIAAFSIAFLTSLALTPLAKRLAFRVGAIDEPSDRKVHKKIRPRLGGLAIVAGFLVPLFVFLDINRPLMGLLAGILILLAVGIIDDTKGLSAVSKLSWQVIAAIGVLAGGIGIVYITNPVGGVVNLDFWQIHIEFFNLSFNILPIANFISILWIVGMINAVNLLDGLDGLAGGVSAIAALVLFISAITPGVGASITVAILSIALLGALLGFLPYNFYPSSIFMGDSGAYSVGMVLALLSIYGSSKVAIGALVMGFAIADMLWAFTRRLFRGQSPFKSDRGHLHHRILDSGVFSHRKTVLFIYVLTTLVAVVILLAGGFAAFILLILLMIGVMSFLRIISREPSRRL